MATLYNDNCDGYHSLAYGECESGWIYYNIDWGNKEMGLAKWEYVSRLRLHCKGM